MDRLSVVGKRKLQLCSPIVAIILAVVVTKSFRGDAALRAQMVDDHPTYEQSGDGSALYRSAGPGLCLKRGIGSPKSWVFCCPALRSLRARHFGSIYSPQWLGSVPPEANPLPGDSRPFQHEPGPASLTTASFKHRHPPTAWPAPGMPWWHACRSPSNAGVRPC